MLNMLVRQEQTVGECLVMHSHMTFVAVAKHTMFFAFVAHLLQWLHHHSTAPRKDEAGCMRLLQDEEITAL